LILGFKPEKGDVAIGGPIVNLFLATAIGSDVPIEFKYVGPGMPIPDF